MFAFLLVGSLVYAGPQPQAPIQTPTAAARDNLNKGVEAFKAQQFDAAIRYFKRSVELDPNSSNGNLYLARVYMHLFVPGLNVEKNLEYADLAIQSLQKLLDAKPNDKTALSTLATIYQDCAKYDRARVCAGGSDTGSRAGRIRNRFIVVKRVVEMHHGKIVASSAGPGRGSTFEIHLPLMEVSATSPDAAAPAKSAARRILVVDDNADSADSLAMVLGFDGHEVLAVLTACRPSNKPSASSQK